MNAKVEKKKSGRPFANKDLSHVLDAAAIIFSKKGFDGAQVKDIAQKVDISTSLLQYHIKTKEKLWKRTVSRLAEELLQHLKEIESYFKDLNGIPLMKAYNRQFIYFSAKRPEFFKIVFQEIGDESLRAEWLLDEILDPIHKQFIERVSDDHNSQVEILPNISAAHMQSILLGAANIFFALSFQFKRQHDIDVFDNEEIDRYITFVNDTIFARFES